jgi:hypothetical protein
VLDGFTIYEADGAFWDEALFEERTLVIRLLLVNTRWQDEVAQTKINEIGRILAKDIAPQQRQIWITSLSGYLAVFEGARGDDQPEAN